MAEQKVDKQVNIKKPNVEFRNGWTIPIVCLVFALAFTAVMIYVIVLQNDRNKHYAEVEAEVISVANYTDYNGDEHHEVFVNYFVNGVKYKQTIRYWEEDLEVGDTTTIKYDVRDPNVIKTTDTFVVLIIIEVSISTALYVVTIWLVIRKIRFDKKLKLKMKAKAERLAKKQQKSLAE